MLEGKTKRRSADPVLIQLLIVVTRRYIPYLRIIRATNLCGQDFLISPFKGVIAYDATLSIEDRHIAVERAIHQLWEVRHAAGLAEYEHLRRHLSAVS